MLVKEELTLPAAQGPAQSSAEDDASPLAEPLVWNEEMELCLSNPELIWGQEADEEPAPPNDPKAETIGLETVVFKTEAPSVASVSGEPEDSKSPARAVAPKLNGMVGFPPAGRQTKGGPELAELVATRAELRRLEKRCQQLDKLRWELSNSLTRQQNDFNNYRRRTEQEREDLRQYLLGELLIHFLPVMDNLMRALGTSTQDPSPQTAMQLFQGLELIARQCEDVMAGFGLYRVPALGERFDPGVHEAVALEPTTEVSPDTITQELLRGYQLGNRLLRAAIVKVAVQPEKG